jgi:hypothetical protein
MSWPRIAALAVCLCVFGSGWSWLDRAGERGLDLWKMRALILALMLAVLIPLLGGFPTEHHATKAQEEATSEISADEANEHP